MNEKDAYIEHLENTIKDLQNQVSNLTEMVLLLRKEKFASSSEKTPKQVDGQLSLFNEAEIEADSKAEEPVICRKGSMYHRKPKTSREELLKDLPVEEFPCVLHPDDMFCNQCGTSLGFKGESTCEVCGEYPCGDFHGYWHWDDGNGNCGWCGEPMSVVAPM